MSKAPHLTDQQITLITQDLIRAESLRQDYARNWSRKALARKHGVSWRTLSNLAQRAGLTPQSKASK